MITLRVTVGYNDAPCEFEMSDGVTLWRHIETLIRHTPKTEEELEIRIKRIITDDEPLEEVTE